MSDAQSLCYMICADLPSCNYRAKDKLGLSLVPIAARLNNRLSFDPAQNLRAPDVSERDWTRFRVATHWSVVTTHVYV